MSRLLLCPSLAMSSFLLIPGVSLCLWFLLNAQGVICLFPEKDKATGIPDTAISVDEKGKTSTYLT